MYRLTFREEAAHNITLCSRSVLHTPALAVAKSALDHRHNAHTRQPSHHPSTAPIPMSIIGASTVGRPSDGLYSSLARFVPDDDPPPSLLPDGMFEPQPHPPRVIDTFSFCFSFALTASCEACESGICSVWEPGFA